MWERKPREPVYISFRNYDPNDLPSHALRDYNSFMIFIYLINSYMRFLRTVVCT